MTQEQARQLTPEESYIGFAGSKYKVADLSERFGAMFIGIYDEPPSQHIDYLNAGNCEWIEPAPSSTPQSVEGSKIVEIPKPIGEFILAQKDIKFMQFPDGYYYHYSEVCVVLNRYGNSLVGDKEREHEYLLSTTVKGYENILSESKSALLQAQKEIKYLNDDMKFNIDLRVTEINKLKSEVEYWKARCEAAELNIETYSEWQDATLESNTEVEIQDLYKKFQEANDKWQALKQQPIK